MWSSARIVLPRSVPHFITAAAVENSSALWFEVWEPFMYLQIQKSPYKCIYFEENLIVRFSLMISRFLFNSQVPLERVAQTATDIICSSADILVKNTKLVSLWWLMFEIGTEMHANLPAKTSFFFFIVWCLLFDLLLILLNSLKSLS